MSNLRKLSAFRQLSLNYETHSEQRRTTLKKQFSEDLPDIRISLKTRIDPPPPIKIAWEEEKPKENGVIVKKCKEVKRPPPKITRHNSLEKDSILYSKQELADRLRQTLEEREQEKHNINIFLAHNTKEPSNEETDDEQSQKTVKLLKPQLFNLDHNQQQIQKNVFQIRKTHTKVRPKNEPLASPTVNRDIKVIATILESNIESKAINNVIIRPATAATAAARRERFQKRTNSAFNGSNGNKDVGSRPPLVRSSSAPSKPEKPKFVATKRKVKLKRKEIKDEDDDNSNKENPKNRKELNKFVPVNGADIVTMVSLVSPAGSDNEDIVEIDDNKNNKCKTRNNSPTKNSGSKEEKEKEKEQSHPKNMSLRKTVKSVSFQQSSIHAIRSFSASFPARRSSMATALMAGNLKMPKANDKRNSIGHDEDDEREAKRRLLRPQSSPQKSFEDRPLAPNNGVNIAIDIKNKPPDESKTRQENYNQPSVEAEYQKQEQTEINEKEEEKFVSVKEKQCWEMYCKMSKKGVNVSYDTILRGMLTPTEYRMSRRESVTTACILASITPQEETSLGTLENSHP